MLSDFQLRGGTLGAGDRECHLERDELDGLNELGRQFHGGAELGFTPASLGFNNHLYVAVSCTSFQLHC